MALRVMVDGDDPILRKKSREVTEFGERLHQLLDDMYDTMTTAGGVGLAGVQVGVLRRVAIIEIGEERIELINPVITERSEEALCEVEGCLSFPGQSGMVERPKSVAVQAVDRNGQPFSLSGENLLARAICHELDHLDGVVYLDIATQMLDSDDDED